MPKTVSTRDIQRSYRKVFDEVKETQEPVVVMKYNQPEVAIIPVEKLPQTEMTTYDTPKPRASKLNDAAGIWANREGWEGKNSGAIVREMRSKRKERLYREND